MRPQKEKQSESNGIDEMTGFPLPQGWECDFQTFKDFLINKYDSPRNLPMHEWILTEPLPELIFSLKHHSPTTYLVREGKYPLTKHSPKIFDTESRYVFDATSLQDLYQRFIEVSSTDRKETH